MKDGAEQSINSSTYLWMGDMLDSAKYAEMERSMYCGQNSGAGNKEYRGYFYFAFFEAPDPSMEYKFSKEKSERFQKEVLDNSSFKMEESCQREFIAWVMETHNIMMEYLHSGVSGEQYCEFIQKASKAKTEDWIKVTESASSPNMIIAGCCEVLYDMKQRVRDYRRAFRVSERGAGFTKKKFRSLAHPWTGLGKQGDNDLTKRFLGCLYMLENDQRENIYIMNSDLFDPETKLIHRKVRVLASNHENNEGKELQNRLEKIMRIAEMEDNHHDLDENAIRFKKIKIKR
ncbi:uncharacterized protein SAPINGB_P001830 [Magnusiomyces paraingens]|uniref:Uncharacterized protein n=1 Tax=Magnusiomyces paraingens TaxID=2606893 RepID=A0A5E8BIG6_9ASCO|nr:uncharacterized protein SAPINGB_P001830 [Saprochaete ingens]VVT48543.1 unnamed protein product [Saprochaete ingens]